MIPMKTNDGWDTADLGSENVNSNLVGALFTQINANTYKNIHSVLIVKNGKLLVEEYFPGRIGGGPDQVFARDTVHTMQSATKSVNSILLGIALDQHLIGSVEENVSRLLPAYSDLFTNAPKDSLRLRHLLSMTAGLSWNEWSPPFTDPRNELVKMYRGSNDFFRYVLEKPMAAAPGEKFAYSSAISILLGEILHQACGLRPDQFAERYLFGPLGITHYEWYRHPNGVVNTGGGLSLRPRDMAKIGLLFLNCGRWRGKQIVSEAWVKASTEPQPGAGAAQMPVGAGATGYGFQWWLGSFQVHHQAVKWFGGMGQGGQFIFVFPDLQTVAVFTGWNANELWGQPLDMLYRYILPAVMPQPPGDERLADRMKNLTLPQVTAGTAISADELLRKALEARGGPAAATNIHSFHAKGMIDLDNGWIAPSPIELFRVRPNRYRAVIDLKLLAGQSFGQNAEGFDGQTAWIVGPSTPPQLLEGKLLQQRQEDAEFFAWYDEPARYRSAEILGGVSYGNKRCYAVKLTTKSGRERFHYYDAATFLLTGLIATVETETGPAMQKTRFSDYRRFGGFLFPTRFSVETQPIGRVTRCTSIEYRSIEVNTVEESDVKMPTDSRVRQ
jgi:CubicO group peptidase (beta-lactamase class C family)